MDYEKKYKKALDNASVMHKCGNSDVKQIMEQLFPELMESEDERIRGAIIDHLKDNNLIEWAAWLEKQGEQKHTPKHKIGDTIYYSSFGEVESMVVSNVVMDGTDNPMYEDKEGNAVFEKDLIEQKPVDKVEPKFKVGDWVMLDRPTLITKVEDMPYNIHKYWTSDNTWFGDATNAKLWTIQDAKDGDVLCVKYGNDKMPFIFTGKQDDIAYCALNSFGEFVLSMAEWLIKVSVLPATKEQRDLLFQKMKEAGYKWDAAKKELSKIEQNIALSKFESKLCELFQKFRWYKNTPTNGDILEYVKTHSTELLDIAINEQNPAWSEEDIIHINKCISYMSGLDSSEMDWLKSLKKRVLQQSKQEWSEKG